MTTKTTPLTRKEIEGLTHETLFASEFVKLREMALQWVTLQERNAWIKEVNEE